MTRCLALVRPVGMNDDMASDWLAAAAAEVAHLSDFAFREGCAKARRDCTHHGQIIPTLLKAGEAAAPPYRRDDGWSGYEFPKPQPALPAPDLTPDSIAALPAPMQSIGLQKGWLKRDDAGALVPA